jgi:hypothetical protein
MSLCYLCNLFVPLDNVNVSLVHLIVLSTILVEICILIFLLLKFITSDGQDSGPVTRKLHGTGPLFKTSDGHFVSPVTGIHILVTGICPSLVIGYQ